MEGEVTHGQPGEVTASAEGGYERRGNAPLVPNGSNKKWGREDRQTTDF